MQKVILVSLALFAVAAGSAILEEKTFFGLPPLFIPLPFIPTIKPVVTPNTGACGAAATNVACTCGANTCQSGETCTSGTCAVVNPNCLGGATQTPCTCGADTCTVGESCTLTSGTCA